MSDFIAHGKDVNVQKKLRNHLREIKYYFEKLENV